MKLDIVPLDEADQENADSATETGNEENNGIKKKKNNMKLEVKEYQSTINSDGEEVVKDIESKAGESEEVVEEKSEYPMTFTKQYSQSKLFKVELQVFSPHIQEALRTVVKSYPEVSFNGSVYLMSSKTSQLAMACLFHHRKELEAYSKTLEDLTAKLHITLALNFMEKHFRHLNKRYDLLVESTSPPSIEFDHIWAIFRPGDLLYVEGEPWQERIVQLISVSYNESTEMFFPSPPKWTIRVKTFGFDGDSFGYRHLKYSIKEFGGIREINKLPIYPLKYHKSKDELRKRMLTRGTTYCSLAGVHHRAYDGVARAVDHERVNGMWGITDEYPEIDMRVRLNHNFSPFISVNTKGTG